MKQRKQEKYAEPTPGEAAGGIRNKGKQEKICQADARESCRRHTKQRKVRKNMPSRRPGKPQEAYETKKSKKKYAKLTPGEAAGGIFNKEKQEKICQADVQVSNRRHTKQRKVRKNMPHRRQGKPQEAYETKKSKKKYAKPTPGEAAGGIRNKEK